MNNNCKKNKKKVSIIQKIIDILVKIKNNLILIFKSVSKYISNNILTISFLFILLLLIYIIYTSLNKFDDIFEAKEFASLLTNSLKDLALAFSPILTLLLTSKSKKMEFNHEKEIKKIEQQIDNDKQQKKELQIKLYNYIEVCLKYINDNQCVNSLEYIKAYIELLSQLKDKDLFSDVQHSYRSMINLEPSNIRLLELRNLVVKYSELSTKN